MKRNIIIPTLLALATFAGAFGATVRNFQETLSTSGQYLWTSPENWGGTVPVATDKPAIANNTSALMKDYTLTGGVFTAFSIGTASTSTGELTVSNSSFEVVDTGAGLSIGGGNFVSTSTIKNATLSLLNGSTVTASFLKLSRGHNTALTDFGQTNDGYAYIDGTSMLSLSGSAELGRRFGRGYLTLGNGTSSLAGQHAELYVGGHFYAGQTESATVYGIGHVTMGTYSVITHTTTVGYIGSASSLTNNGGFFYSTNSNFMLLTNSSMVFNGGTGEFKDMMTTTVAGNAAFTITNASKVSLTGNMTFNGSTLTVSASTLSVGSVMSQTNSAVHINDSTLSIGSVMTLTASSALNISNSTLSIGSAMSLTNSALHISNSTVSVGEMINSLGTTINVTGSTISAAGISAHFATNIVSISGGSLLTLESTAAQTFDDATTGYIYVNDASTVNVNANGLIATSRFIVGNDGTGSFTMNGGVARLRNLYIGRNADDKEAGAGIVSVMGGRVIPGTGNTDATIHVGGVTGSGMLNVGGTGKILVNTLNMSANGTFSGALYVYNALSSIDDVQNGEAGVNSLIMAGGATFKGVAYVDVGTSISLNASGSVSTMRSVSFDDLTLGEGAELIIDFKNVVLSVAGGESLALITAVTLAGQADMIYTTKNLQAGYQVDYEWRNVSGLETLFADISLIPEPSACAGLLGLLALAAAVRRRR